jgi:transposase
MVMKCKRDSDGRSINKRSIQVLRQQAVKAVGRGESATSVAATLGVNVRTVFRWLSNFACGGQNALLTKFSPGRPPKVTPEEMRWIAAAVRDKSPQQMKFEFGLWTLSLIGEMIWRQFGKRLTKPSVGRIMRILGFTPQRPLYRAWQQDPVMVEKWQAEDFPRLRTEAKQAGALIYFADEAGVRSDYHAGTTWAPCGRTPVVKATGRRFGLNVISAVSARGDFRFMVHEGTVTAVVFREFLKRLMLGTKQPIILVVDGHPTHKAKLVKEYVEQQQGKLKLVYLPPYSPQLNPDEQVWGYVKSRVAKQLPENKDQLKQLLVSVLRRLQKLPLLVAAFFRHPECRYALP